MLAVIPRINIPTNVATIMIVFFKVHFLGVLYSSRHHVIASNAPSLE